MERLRNYGNQSAEYRNIEAGENKIKNKIKKVQAQLDQHLAKSRTPTPVSYTPEALPGESAEEKRERLASQEIAAHQAGIEAILNKYTSSHISCKEASKILMGD